MTFKRWIWWSYSKFIPDNFVMLLVSVKLFILGFVIRVTALPLLFNLLFSNFIQTFKVFGRKNTFRVFANVLVLSREGGFYMDIGMIVVICCDQKGKGRRR